MRARVALFWLTLAATAYAEPPLVDVEVDCPTLSFEQRGAFEARARADLSARNLSGWLHLWCRENVEVTWRQTGELPVARAVPLAQLNVDVLLETLALLLEPLPEPAELESVPPPAAAINAPVQTKPGSPATPPNSEQPTDAAKPSAPGGAPRPKRNAGPLASRAAPRVIAPSQSASHDAVGTLDAARPVERGGSRWLAPNHVSLSATAGAWYTQPTWGALAAAGHRLHESLGVAATLEVQRAPLVPDGFTAQSEQLDVGLFMVLDSQWTFALLAGANLAHVWTSERRLSQPLDERCAGADVSVRCWSAALRGALLWRPAGAGFQPQVGLSVAWLAWPVEISEVSNGGASEPEGLDNVEFSLPWIRPSLVFGLVWVEPGTR